MSPIGRVFIVLNLVLAGVFVGFAGTYLQRATDWKDKFEKLQTASRQEIDGLNGQLTAKTAEKDALQLKLSSSEQNLNRQVAENKDLTNENERLDNKLSSIEGDLKAMQANQATVASSIERATSDAASYHKTSMEATAARDQAVREKEVAVADLRDANMRIANLESDLGARDGAIAELTQTVGEKEILLALVNARAPGILENAQPYLGGTVIHVDSEGKLVTVSLTENPGGAEIKPGYSLAIFSGTTYKAEAQITDVDGSNAFCRVVRDAGVAPISTGDRAVTNTY